MASYETLKDDDETLGDDDESEEEIERSQEGTRLSMSFEELKIWEPSHGPRQVFNDIEINMLSDISDLEQTFKVKFVLKQEWMLSGQERDDYAAAGSEGMSNLWEPALPKIMYAVDHTITKEQEPTIALWGNMLTATRDLYIDAELTESFELQSFPFDSQDFTITLRFPEADTVMNMLPNLKEESFIRMADSALASSQWALSEPMCEIRKLKKEGLDRHFKNTVTSHFELAIFCKASRNSMSYVFRIGLIMFIVSSSALFSFVVYDVEGSGADELALGSTSLLTALAFQYVVTSLLPVLGYLTLIDMYALANIAFIFLCMSCNALMVLLNLSERVNGLVGFTAAILLVAMNAAFAFHIKRTIIPREQQKLTALPVDGGGLGRGQTVHTTLTKFQLKTHHGTAYFGSNYGHPATNNAGSLAGVWWSPDYNSASSEEETEFMHVSIAAEEGKPSKLIITKITGDENVAAGKITVRAEDVPVVGGKKVPASIALAGMGGRGLNYHPGIGLSAVSNDQIVFHFQEGQDINYYRLQKPQ